MALKGIKKHRIWDSMKNYAKAGRVLALLGAMSALSFAADASDLISASSPVCKFVGLTPYAGGLLMLTAGSMAAFNYMKGDVESRQSAKIGLEGIVVGAAILLMIPFLVQYIFGFTVCS